MATFDCILKFGHMGAGQAFERRVRIRAYDILDAMRRARRIAGCKKGRGAPPLLRLSRIS